MRKQMVVIGVVSGIAVVVLLGLSGVIPFPVTLLSTTGQIGLQGAEPSGSEAVPMTNEELLTLFWDEEAPFAEFLNQLARTHPVATTWFEEWIEEGAATFAYSPEEFKLRFRDLLIWPNIGDGRISLTLAEYRDQFVEKFPVAAAFLEEWALDFVDYSPEELDTLRRLRSDLSDDLDIRWRGRPEDGRLGIAIGPRRVSPEGEDR